MTSTLSHEMRMLPVQQQQQSMTHKGLGGLRGGSAVVHCSAVRPLGKDPWGVSTIVADCAGSAGVDRGPADFCRCDHVRAAAVNDDDDPGWSTSSSRSGSFSSVDGAADGGAADVWTSAKPRRPAAPRPLMLPPASRVRTDRLSMSATVSEKVWRSDPSGIGIRDGRQPRNERRTSGRARRPAVSPASPWRTDRVRHLTTQLTYDDVDPSAFCGSSLRSSCSSKSDTDDIVEWCCVSRRLSTFDCVWCVFGALRAHDQQGLFARWSPAALRCASASFIRQMYFTVYPTQAHICETERHERDGK